MGCVPHTQPFSGSEVTKATGILGILGTLLQTRETAGNSVSVTASKGRYYAKSFINARVLVLILTTFFCLSLFFPSHSPEGLFLTLSPANGSKLHRFAGCLSHSH